MAGRSPSFARRLRGRALGWLRTPSVHEWLLVAVLLVMTERYLWLMDDSFIYFRYADNALFLDRGLVYNAGEFVEGYSSPLWMLLMLACRATELDYYTLVRALALVCAASFGFALIWVNRRLTAAVLRPTINFPLAAAAAHYGITTHFSSGLETPLVQLCAPLYAAALLRPGSALLQLAMGLVPLVRAECGLLWVGYVPWLWLATRRIPWCFLASALLANAAWLAFRVYYYADFLPNTFYLKDVAQWSLGWEYLYNVSETHHWPWVLCGLAACALLGRRYLHAQRVPRAILLGSAFAYALYVVRIGGDMLYHRYAALPVCLVLCASAGVLEAALLPRVPAVPALARRMIAAYAAVVVCIAFGSAYPRQLDTHPFWFGENLRNWRAVSDASWHRHHENLRYDDAKRRKEDLAQRAAYARLRARGEPRDPPIYVEGFCRTGYDRIGGYVINDYGLTDAALARLPRPFGRPGHKFVQQEAQDIKALRVAARRRPGLRWYQLAHAPRWVKQNRAGLEALEQKQRNGHVFTTNLALALRVIRLE